MYNLLRDPRDVARSSIGMGWAGDVYHGAKHWVKTEGDWAACTPHLSTNQVLTVRYEDLVQDPQAELTRICTFADVKYQPAMLEYDIASTYSKPDMSRINQWKRKLSSHELGLIEGRVGDLLAASGYESSGVAPKILSAPNMVALKMKNRC